MTKPAWLNRTVVGTGLTSLLADMSYESVLSLMPGFLTNVGGGPAVLGIMEGSADALASFVKLGSGWYSDRIARRKPIAVAGYVLTGIMPAIMAIAVTWPMVMFARLVGWFGKGMRGPARDALLAASVSGADRGKAFGFHRAGDTVGAVLGPLLAAWLIGWLPPPAPERTVIWLAVIPGLGAAVALGLLVKELRPATAQRRKLFDSVRLLPKEYRYYLIAVGVFGAGDFAATLLILAAVQALEPTYGPIAAAQWGAMLYALRNVAAAITAYPVGALSDRIGRRGLLAAGYALGAIVMVGFAAAFATGMTGLPILAGLFALVGVYIAVEETLEGATAADLVSDPALRGTAFGVLGCVNGIGDFLSSTIVGLLWVWSPIFGFVYAAVMMALGAAMLAIRRFTSVG